jgi:very-short-patch-repair endonuclease
MTERTAVYYGQLELIPGIFCDGYVLDDGTAVMSERGTADLLGMDHAPLKRMVLTWPPKVLKPFINNNFIMRGNMVKVNTNRSPYQGRSIVVYDAVTIENIIRAYLLSFGYGKFRQNQLHIVERCSILSASLMRTALDTAIKQACGITTNIQQTAQQHYIDIVKLIKEAGFTCSIPNDIATKKDIAQFLDIPESTLNSFLAKHKDEIQPIKLDRATIRAMGSKATAMNGYHIDNVSKIAMGMDSVVGLELKKKVFGQLGPFIRPQTAAETQWQEVLTKVFAGFDLRFNYPIGPYKVDFFVAKLLLVLECNGYCHRFYDFTQEQKREEFISQNYALVRFHHRVSLETLFNGILQAKPGTVIQLYDLTQLGQDMPFGVGAECAI